MCLAVIFFIFPVWPSFGDWEPVGDGIDYQYWRLESPANDVFVARMDRKNANCIIDSSIGNGKLSGNTSTWETVRGMAERYDDSLNFWGQSWGKRSKVVVAINGDYYWTSSSHPEPYFPQSGQVQTGWFARRFLEWSGGTGFVFKMDGSCFLGGNVTNGQQYANPKQTVRFWNDVEMQIHRLNYYRADGQLVLYTHQFGATTQTSADGVEVEEPLGGVLMRPIARVDNTRLHTLREYVRRAGSRVPHYYHIDVHGLDISRGVLERLSLEDAG